MGGIRPSLPTESHSANLLSVRDPKLQKVQMIRWVWFKEAARQLTPGRSPALEWRSDDTLSLYIRWWYWAHWPAIIRSSSVSSCGSPAWLSVSPSWMILTDQNWHLFLSAGCEPGCCLGGLQQRLFCLTYLYSSGSTFEYFWRVSIRIISMIHLTIYTVGVKLTH